MFLMALIVLPKVWDRTGTATNESRQQYLVDQMIEKVIFFC